MKQLVELTNSHQPDIVAATKICNNPSLAYGHPKIQVLGSLGNMPRLERRKHSPYTFLVDM